MVSTSVKLWMYGAALLVAATAFVVYFKGSGVGGPAGGAGPNSLAGTAAPSFRLTRFDGRFDSLEHYRGKLVVMNLWASWCPPCRAEMPDLQKLERRYRQRGLVVLGINEGESAQTAGSFAQSLGINFPVLLDQEQRYGRVYSTLGLPTTIIVRPDGTIARGIDGALTYSQMRDAVTPLLVR